jgi:hypothetical protein
MPKVRLIPEELEVESFDIFAENARGTVGAQEIQWTGINGYTCRPVMTCWQGGSCPAFSCVSQCDHACFEDWSDDCNFETAANTCWPPQTCPLTCLESCNC